MRRAINTVAVVGLAVASVTALSQGPTANADSQSATYLVLADDAAALDAVVAAVEASGGTVDHLNAAYRPRHRHDVGRDVRRRRSSQAGVAGVAR